MNKQELIQFICELYEIDQCNDMILKQINKYVTEQGYGYKDIARALSYFTDVKGNKPQIQYGIGIVPCMIKEATTYYESLRKQRETQVKTANNEKEKAKLQTDDVVIYCPLKKEKTIKRKSINMDNL